MRDFRYIIKRIIIGVGIALVLGFIRGNLLLGVKALTVSNVTVDASDSAQAFTNETPYIQFGGNWSIWTNSTGYVMGTFSVQKITGSSTSTVVTLRYVLAQTPTTSFACQIGSVTANNSTSVSQTYTYVCPVSLGSSGLSSILVGFDWLTTQDPTQYRINFNNNLTLYNESPQINFDTSSTTTAIESMEQAIIDNQQQQTEAIVESNKVCTMVDKFNISQDGLYFYYNGTTASNSDFGITDYFSISSSSSIKVLSVRGGVASTCFYNINKTVISCIQNQAMSVNDFLTIPSNASFVRFSINKSENKPTFQICTNGNQAIVDTQKETNDLIKNDDVSGANSKASEFFNDFTAESHGLSGIVSAPLRLITSLSSSTCTSLTLPLPFVSQNAVLPCMSTVYSNFPTFLSLWQLISTGLIAYWIVIRLFYKVHEFQDPESDRIEVLDL